MHSYIKKKTNLNDEYEMVNDVSHSDVSAITTANDSWTTGNNDVTFGLVPVTSLFRNERDKL